MSGNLQTRVEEIVVRLAEERQMPRAVTGDAKEYLRSLDGQLPRLVQHKWGREGVARGLLYFAAKNRGLVYHDIVPMKLLITVKKTTGIQPRQPSREEYLDKIAMKMGLPQTLLRKAHKTLRRLGNINHPMTAAAVAIHLTCEGDLTIRGRLAEATGMTRDAIRKNLRKARGANAAAVYPGG